MNRRIGVIAAILLLSMFAGTVTQVAGADYSKVGVKNGDYVRYNWATTDQSYWNTYPIKYALMTVTSVIGTLVTITQMYYFQNGTSYQDGLVSPLTGDISTGSNSIVYGIIPLGLQAGDLVPGSTVLSINVTKVEHIGSFDRVVNELKMTGMELWWDQETGLMVYGKVTSTYPTTQTVTMTFDTTNAWSSSNAPTSGIPTTLIITIGAVAAVAAVAILFVVLRARKK